MRIGTVGIGKVRLGDTPDATIQIIGGDGGDGSIIPGTSQSGGYTSGPSVTGDTLMCPPAHPYDYTIHDCSGWEGSPEQGQVLTLQAAMDVCTSGGRTWDQLNNRCVVPTASNQLIPGVPNIAVYLVGGLLVFTALKGRR